ncbi:hypothetical protein ACODM8_12505 [Vibrio ostreicida]|uniref:Uncharacterized protein n=1 Tax=Vibrio ostreicida TaxID=526588 RepID=A0ABT8BZZ4_9VIBR|nr:hypothetical protein [Vibrio ostreicida]MDN3612387.1 hypothetical protein [Vibrio ostreicida]NPD09842.1 hypothetical protein [Vibrio ostreicida]
MYQELSQLLDKIGFTYNKHELKICTTRAQKIKAIKMMLMKAKELNFDVSSNLNKSVLAGIASQQDITDLQAIDLFSEYVASNEAMKQQIRESLFLAVLRKSEEFDMTMTLNGEGQTRVF